MRFNLRELIILFSFVDGTVRTFSNFSLATSVAEFGRAEVRKIRMRHEKSVAAATRSVATLQLSLWILTKDKGLSLIHI